MRMDEVDAGAKAFYRNDIHHYELTGFFPERAESLGGVSAQPELSCDDRGYPDEPAVLSCHGSVREFPSRLHSSLSPLVPSSERGIDWDLRPIVDGDGPHKSLHLQIIPHVVAPSQC